MDFFIDLRAQSIPESLDRLNVAGLIVDEHLPSHHPQLQISGNEILDGEKVKGKLFQVKCAEDMQSLMDLEDYQSDFLYIETGDWHIIPLENVIAKFSTSSTRLMASAHTPQEIELLSTILEIGVDICIIHLDRHDLEDFLPYLTENQTKVELIEAEVSQISRIGSGDRVCVDTVSLLKDGEGLLVGSTAKIMTLIQAEVAETGFVSARPFRVNAGVVSLYTYIGDKTKYLSELKSGDKVLIVDRYGNTRLEHITRIKIERRPLIMVQVMYEGRDYPIILQDAETVKVMTKSSSVRVDKLVKGDKILISVLESGRHFGMAVDEQIDEK
ncbi:MAG: 3-dehydroquinate synthase II [Candidatus Heimdallarchaeota archaeon]|nr:3-dehydroquinate synthase II [Candidatus Heimdallarchaeota archaeon]